MDEQVPGGRERGGEREVDRRAGRRGRNWPGGGGRSNTAGQVYLIAISDLYGNVRLCVGGKE